MTQKTYAVDIDANCKAQEFIVHRGNGFITGKPTVIVEGMGLQGTAYGLKLNVDASDTSFIYALLATVDCIPLNVRNGD